MSSKNTMKSSDDIRDSPIGKMSKLADRKTRDERAKRRDGRTTCRDEPASNIDREEYVSYIVGRREGDLPRPHDSRFTSKSFKDKNIECGDLVWLSGKCSNVVGIISTIDRDEALVEIHTFTGKAVITLRNTDVELKRKASQTKPIADFRIKK